MDLQHGDDDVVGDVAMGDVVEGVERAESRAETVTERTERAETTETETTDSILGSTIEADSIHSGDIGDTVSVTSNIWRFEKENGRTYHGYRPGLYYYPNDPSETERLDHLHCVIDHALRGVLHTAPLSNPSHILDIGTGTGAWAMQMADAYPHAVIEATDLSPIQPSSVPDNVHFIIDDAEQDDWAVPENHYDYIHSRVLMGALGDYRALIHRGFRYTKPGGYMESQDIMHPPFCDDGTMPDDWPYKEWSETMDEAAVKAGRPLTVAHMLKQWYIEAGFVDVRETVVKFPINSWPRNRHLKYLGKYWAENLLAGLQGFSLALFSRVFGWNRTEIEVYLVKIRKSITDHRVHSYHKYYIVYGRKPEIPTEGCERPAEPTFTCKPPLDAPEMMDLLPTTSVSAPPAIPLEAVNVSDVLPIPPGHPNAGEHPVEITQQPV